MKTVEIIKTYKVLGFTEEITTCDCCGREDLKGTLALENTETGDINYFGSVCGGKIAGNTKKFMEEQLTIAEKENLRLVIIEFRASEAKQGYDEWMLERENYFYHDQPYEEVKSLWIKTTELSDRVAKVKAELCKKYYIKHSYKLV